MKSVLPTKIAFSSHYQQGGTAPIAPTNYYHISTNKSEAKKIINVEKYHFRSLGVEVFKDKICSSAEFLHTSLPAV